MQISFTHSFAVTSAITTREQEVSRHKIVRPHLHSLDFPCLHAKLTITMDPLFVQQGLPSASSIIIVII